MIKLRESLYLQKIGKLDAVQLSEIAIQAYRDHYLHLWEDNGEAYIYKSFHPENLAVELADSNNIFWLIYLDNQAVGFLKVKLISPLLARKNAFELERIYLTKAAAGQGIGEKIMQFLFDFAQSRKQTIIWLKVMDSSQSAIRFYEKMGFEICGTYHLDLPFMKNEVRGMYLMQKLLKKS